MTDPDLDPFGSRHWLHDAPRTGLAIAGITLTAGTASILMGDPSLVELSIIPICVGAWYALLRWDAADARLQRAADAVDDE